ncbi:MAG: T9SS type A sorting domain-containing protein, partial [Bacteroidales bacterium]|nr:T9SS type A sorting domain-containing protein [Bacteroidales bacterium]
TGVDQPLQRSTSLSQNYPNPFTGSTSIPFTLAQTDHVRLTVTDLSGNLLETLVNQSMVPGDYRVQFQASDLPAGVYLYHLRTTRQMETKKLVILN